VRTITVGTSVLESKVSSRFIDVLFADSLLSDKFGVTNTWPRWSPDH
jgi:hypothetical protein